MDPQILSCRCDLRVEDAEAKILKLNVVTLTTFLCDMSKLWVEEEKKENRIIQSYSCYPFEQK